MTLARMLALALAIAALAACGGPRPHGPDETTETWTSGDDEALGITTTPGDEPSSPEASDGV